MIKPVSFLFCIVMISFAWISCSSKASEPKRKKPVKATHGANVSEEVYLKLKQHASSATAFVRKEHLNTRFCFLIDMSRPSGKNRFFVYNLEKDSVEMAGLVAHGRCNEDWLEGRRYSNIDGSGCTSLGRYKTGGSYNGQFGLAYKLYGLDATNSNAYARFVVLHAYDYVPDMEVSPKEICQSNGCPMVSPAFLKRLVPRLNQSARPVLLWIYE